MNAPQMVAKSTVDLLGELTKPYTATGLLPKSERQALLKILSEHTPDRLKHEQAPQKDMLTVAEVSERLGVSKTTIWRMRKTGELRGRYLKSGSPKTLRIELDSVNAVLYGKEAV